MEKEVLYSLGNKNQLHSSSPSHSKHFNERTDVISGWNFATPTGLKYRCDYSAQFQPWRNTQISMRKFTEVQKHYSAPFSALTEKMIGSTWIFQPVWPGWKSKPGLKIPGWDFSSPCNRQLDFKRICFRSRAEISARDEIRHANQALRAWWIMKLTCARFARELKRASQWQGSDLTIFVIHVC